MNNIATYELANWQDGIVSLNTNIDQQANPQGFNSPQLPAGSTVNLKSLVSQGRGKVTGRLDRLIPSISTVSISSNAVMSAKNSGSHEELIIITKMSMEMNLESK